jgi:hypothetical protein
MPQQRRTVLWQVHGRDANLRRLRPQHGAVDDPPDYGEEVRAAYAEQAALKHPNGKPQYAPDGTMLNDDGTRSIFDDIDL